MPLVALILAVVVHFLPSDLYELCIYHRQQIEQGQWWRIISGHFAHTNLNHLLLNLAGLVMLWALHGDHYQHRSFSLVFLISAVTCSLGIYLWTPEMTQYVGLSGVLHGVFVWGAIKDIEKGWRSGYLLLIGVWAKIAWEQVSGASADVEQLINAKVAIDAHLFGALGGVVAVLLLTLRSKLAPRLSPSE